ncbi:MAG: sulfite exporter TauE/SafE family protein [Phycisphaerae bacterium]
MIVYALIGAAIMGVSLGLFGAGGTTLAVPILVYLVGHSEKQAIIESLAIVGTIAAAGCLQAAVRRRVSWAHVILFGAPGMVGAFLGAFAAKYIPGVYQLLALAVMIFFVAAMMLRPVAARPASAATWLAVPPGFGVGLVTGTLGVGGGFMIVPALVLLCGLDISIAIGTSLGIIALNSFVGFAKSAATAGELGVTLNPSTIAIFAIVGSLGGSLGSYVGGHIDQQRLRKAFALFLICLAAYILVVEGRHAMRM